MPAAYCLIPTLAGAGALRSTANDLLGFLAAVLGVMKSSLSPAMTAMLAVRQPAGGPGREVALGWHILTTPGGRDIAWHNGGTGGYRSFMGFDQLRAPWPTPIRFPTSFRFRKGHA